MVLEDRERKALKNTLRIPYVAGSAFFIRSLGEIGTIIYLSACLIALAAILTYTYTEHLKNHERKAV